MSLIELPAGMIVTPGASADRNHRTLIALDEGLAEISVRRLTLGTTSVARAVDKIVSASDELAAELGVDSERILLGGRSFGGRACSLAVAEGLPAAGLALLSYPLHPPGKPEKLRVDHFPSIGVPTLFVSGEKDPFGSPAEFAEHVGEIAGRTEMSWIPGGHSPKDDEEVVQLVRGWLGIA
ncbi:MAG: alpha/beta hydrolase family protein [Acidimicrobiales bacterium]